MPHMLTEGFNALKSLAGIFGSTQEEASASELTSNPDEQAQQDDLVRSRSVEEVPAPAPTRHGKRVQGVENVESGGRSKRQAVSTPVAYLEKHHRPTPPDAVPIRVLDHPSISIAERSYESTTDWKPEHKRSEHGTRNMGGTYKPRGAVRPLDTLNRSAPQNARNVATHVSPGQYQRSALRPSQHQTLPINGSRGSNVSRPAGFSDDLAPQQPLAKKRRMTETQKSNAVDLTSDDEDFSHAVVMPKHQVRINPASQQSANGGSFKAKAAWKGDAFGTNNQMHSADYFVRVDPGKNKSHKPRLDGSKRASFSSSNNSGSERSTTNGNFELLDGTAHAPLDLEEDGVVHMATEHSVAVAKRKRDQDGAKLPLIDLGRGMDEAGEAHNGKKRKVLQGSAEDRANVNQLFGKQTRKPATASAVPRSRPRRTIVQPEAAPQNDKGQKFATQRRPKSERLSANFERDVIEDDGPLEEHAGRKNAPGTTQPSSNRPPTRDPSPDVLDGGSTIRSRKSRNPSLLHKLIPVVSSAKDLLNAREAASEVPTSHLKPTNFVRRKKGDLPQPKQEAHDSWQLREDISEEKDGDERIPIRSIVCKAKVADQDELALLWDPGVEAFVLVVGKDFVSSSLTKGFVLVGKPAISQWIGHDQSTKVVLKGSKDETSSGTTVLEFADLGGKWKCFNGLLQSCPRMAKKSEDQERTDKIFVNMQASERNGHKQAVSLAHSHSHLKQMNELRRKQEDLQPPDDDDIVYESDEPQPRQQRLVERMQDQIYSQASKPRQPLQQYTATHQDRYFRRAGDNDRDMTIAHAIQDEELQMARRSTRQHDGETLSSYFSGEPVRKSTRQLNAPIQYREPSPELEKYTEIHGLPKWAKPVVYPKQGPRRVTIDASDIKNLDLGEFLNDNIVNYRLRDIEEKMTSPQKDRVHFFNTFFFSSLTTQNGKKAFNYDAVKKWTKSVDLFSKPYVIVPINLDLHWFVAIIYNLPAVKRRLLDSDVEAPIEGRIPLSNSDTTPARADGTRSSFEKLTLTDNAEHDEHGKIPNEDDIIPTPDQAEGVEQQLATVKGKRGKKGKIPPVRKFTADQPMIISLDSFGHPRPAEIKFLKQYVVEEAREKRQIDVSVADLQGVNARGIPQQDNFYDCGVYLLGYVEEFVKDPDHFVNRILGREVDQSDFGEFDTTNMRKTIREDLLQYGNAEDRQYRDEKARRGSAKKLAQTPQAGGSPVADVKSTTMQAASTEVPQPPMSSQPTRDSPSAQKLVRRQNSPSAQETPSTSPHALRGPEAAEAPPSSKLPGAPHGTYDQMTDNEEDIEVTMPHPLPTSRQTAESDDEMLMEDAAESEVPVGVHTGRFATPAGRETKVPDDTHLSPLSSLAKDVKNEVAMTQTVADSPAGNVGPSEGSSQVKIKQENGFGSEYAAVKIENSNKEATSEAKGEDVAQTDIKSEPDESDNGRSAPI